MQQISRQLCKQTDRQWNRKGDREIVWRDMRTLGINEVYVEVAKVALVTHGLHTLLLLLSSQCMESTSQSVVVGHYSAKDFYSSSLAWTVLSSGSESSVQMRDM